MSTIAEPSVEQEPREKPGSDRRKPVHHVVRIVVARNVAVSSSRESHGPGHSHGLTDQELKMGEEVLKGMDTREPTNRTSEPSKSMLDLLKPTDIVVIGREAASVRVLDKDGKPVPLDENGQRASASTAAAPNPPTRRLFGHDARHKDTVLRVWTESDTVEYQCDRPFTIEEVKRAGWHIHRSPANPFERERKGTPYTAIQERTIDASGNLKFVWKWTSGTVPASANNQQYKATFKIDGELIDPDVVCGDPPPG
jgi:hypothetical protein